MATHEKVYITDDGAKLKVVVEMLTHFNSNPTYKVGAFICPKGKRTWSNVVNTDGFGYRRMDMSERAKFRFDECCKVVGIDRISETANELWHLIKPEPNANFER